MEMYHVERNYCEECNLLKISSCHTFGNYSSVHAKAYLPQPRRGMLEKAHSCISNGQNLLCLLPQPPHHWSETFSKMRCYLTLLPAPSICFPSSSFMAIVRPALHLKAFSTYSWLPLSFPKVSPSKCLKTFISILASAT